MASTDDQNLIYHNLHMCQQLNQGDSASNSSDVLFGVKESKVGYLRTLFLFHVYLILISLVVRSALTALRIKLIARLNLSTVQYHNEYKVFDYSVCYSYEEQTLVNEGCNTN